MRAAPILLTAAFIALPALAAEHRDLVWPEDALGEAVAAAREDGTDPAHVADVGADAEDHRGRAAAIARQ